MLGPGHRLMAANVSLLICEALPSFSNIQPTPRTTLAVVLSSMLFSAGRLSPDMDQIEILKRIFGHRYLLHWWGLPFFLVFTPFVYFSVPFIYWGPLIGWTSHLLPADYIFGKAGYGIPKGIPLGPFRTSKRLGLGIKVTGRQKLDGTRYKHGRLELITTIMLNFTLLAEIAYYTSHVSHYGK